jgi:exosortase D (VPLPA-CTERM-specific)
MSVQAMGRPSRSIGGHPTHIGLLIAVLILLALVSFAEPLQELAVRWMRQEEYSHGFLIPLISLWLLWVRRDALIGSIGTPSWAGPLLLLLCAGLHFVGQLSALFILSQVGFVLTLIGIVLATGGVSLLRVSFIPIVFLFFAIPTPYFIDTVLSWRLQLISSELGVAFIRLFQIPVYLTGNVIDLGSYKLQVVDACSGLRYLYPLMSLGFLAAYLFQAPLWKRITVFLSTIPITIAMNSIRIGAVGVTVEWWGESMAEGTLHMFEGWIIFIACSVLLAAEICLLRLGSKKTFFQSFYLPAIAAVASARLPQSTMQRLPIATGTALLVALTVGMHFASSRQEIQPERQRFATFPTKLGAWTGRASLLEPEVEHALYLDDYILSDYSQPKVGFVNFYVAYYASQRQGTSPHSPMVCIPGGGWQITSFERTSYRDEALDLTLPYNRAVIQKDSSKQLVYYWFVQRGRLVANEYWSKWYLFVDALTQNRTDGALVRLVTPIYQNEDERTADDRLQAFIRELQPGLKSFLPGADPKTAKLAQQQ